MCHQSSLSYITHGFTKRYICIYRKHPLHTYGTSQSILIPFFIRSTAATQIFANKRRFPTVLALGVGGFSVVAESILPLMRYHQWTSLSIIMDLAVVNPPFSAFVAIVKKEFAASQAEVRCSFIEVNTAANAEFEEALLAARQHSTGKDPNFAMLGG